MDAADLDYSRTTNHDSNAFWNSTGRKLFDKVMESYPLKFDDIGLEDLEGDNSLVLMSEFVERCARSPPISKHTKRPFASTTLQDTLTIGIGED